MLKINRGKKEATTTPTKTKERTEKNQFDGVPKEFDFTTINHAKLSAARMTHDSYTFSFSPVASVLNVPSMREVADLLNDLADIAEKAA